MFIKKIILENFRIYYDKNEVEFSHGRDKNIFVISGENGFGKTTFLTSLVWCLYGKLMIDVDEKYRRDVYESGGYRKYAAHNLNRLASSEDIQSYSVTVVFSDIVIPSIPCNEVLLKRTFNTNKHDDDVEILIDGERNELTKEVGPEIFINDFILPKEIAKFFFFDSEKIVALAEMKSIEEKIQLSQAYSAVLGIKKYEDLKNNLQDLRIRLKRSSASKKEKEKFDRLQQELKKINGSISVKQQEIENLNELRLLKQRQSEEYQERLIREGNSLSLKELLSLKKLRDRLSEEGNQIKSRLKELLELAPFAIAGEQMVATREQLYKEVENKLNALDPVLIREKIKNIKSYLSKGELKELNLDTRAADKILQALENYISLELLPEDEIDFKILLEFSDKERNEFEAVYSNLKFSYKKLLKQLIREEKNNRITLTKIVRKITNAESKENDLLIKKIRDKKTILDQEIQNHEKDIATLNQEIGGLNREAAVISKQISELAKKIEIVQADQEKDKLAERLIKELDQFINDLKHEKKNSLEIKVREELNRLMHKSTFIDRAEVEIGEEIIDVHLFDKRNKLILKDSLSKGEQQLYATAILKALVDESNIKFPIFIDSPLQKFDKKHSKNIISEFYPNVSDQVVLLPLLEKELSEEEYKDLLPKVNSTFLIKNTDQDRSQFKKIDTLKLFTAFRENEHIHAH